MYSLAETEDFFNRVDVDKEEGRTGLNSECVTLLWSLAEGGVFLVRIHVQSLFLSSEAGYDNSKPLFYVCHDSNNLALRADNSQTNTGTRIKTFMDERATLTLTLVATFID